MPFLFLPPFWHKHSWNLSLKFFFLVHEKIAQYKNTDNGQPVKGMRSWSEFKNDEIYVQLLVNT